MRSVEQQGVHELGSRLALAELRSHDIPDVLRRILLKNIWERLQPTHSVQKNTDRSVCVCTWLGKCPSNYFVSAGIVAFKGILGHAGISSYLKLCQPKRTQFPVCR